MQYAVICQLLGKGRAVVGSGHGLKNKNARSIPREDETPAALPNGRPSSRPRCSTSSTGKNDIIKDDLILPDLETFFSPHEVAAWDEVTQGFYKNISKNYQELQAIGAEMAAGLPDAENGGQWVSRQT
jgi:hypothetical protein